MMSFSGLLSDAYTLFHELGHAGQGVLSHESNSYTGSRPSLYLIEAPSTFHELLLTDYLKERTDDPREERARSEEHTSELQSRFDIVCRLLLEKKTQHNESYY